MEKLANFKGLFHGQKIQVPSFEGGAHFKYSELIDKLNTVMRNISPRRLSNKSSSNESSTEEEILINMGRLNIKKHVSKNKSKKKSKHRKNNSEFNLPKINSNKLNYYKNTIDAKNDSINNLVTNDTESYAEKTILPPIIRKSDDDLNKKRKRIHLKIVSDGNDLLKSEDLNKKTKKTHRRIVSDGNDLLKSEDLSKKRKMFFIQEEESEYNIDDYKEINEPLTIKKNKKKILENNEDILQRISELKKKLLGINNKDKKIKLKPIL